MPGPTSHLRPAADGDRQDGQAPTDPPVVAMLAVLVGEDWRDRLDGEAAFEPGPMTSWAHAVEAMLAAADVADPLRLAIRAVVQEAGRNEGTGAGMPRAES